MVRKNKEKNKGTKSDKPQEAKPYPLWAKLLVSFSVCSALTIGGLFSWLVSDLVMGLRIATDPEQIVKVMKRMLEFDQLPEDFKYQFASSGSDSAMVAVANENEKTHLFFLILPLEKDKVKDAKELVNLASDRGIPILGQDLQIKNRGSMIVGGEKLEYVLASSSFSNLKLGDFIAASIIGKRTAFFVYGITVDKEAKTGAAGEFNLSAAERLFKGIKKIKPDLKP